MRHLRRRRTGRRQSTGGVSMDQLLRDIDDALADWDATKRALHVAEWVTAAGLPPLTRWQLDILRGLEVPR